MKSIELFAGAGGLAIGTSNAGFRHAAVLELNQNACATLRTNQRNGLKALRGCHIVEGNVADYSFRQHRDDVDFIFGGPPCQPFSIGGKHGGHNDARNMFPQAVRAIREVRPKAFMFENVKGLLRSNFSNYYNYIIRQLEFPNIQQRGDEEWGDHLARLEEVKTGETYGGLKYTVLFQLYNSANWGVPQKRERVLVVGIRSDLHAEFSFPTRYTHTEDALLYDKWVSGDYWERHKVAKRLRDPIPPRLVNRIRSLRGCLREFLGEPWQTVRDATTDLPQLRLGQTCVQFSNHFLNPGAKSYPGHTGSPIDEPAKALKAGDHGVPGGENMLRRSDGSVRYFTVRECARLQAFPDDWEFEGSWTESMRQLGNAVPVTLVEVVAKQLAKSIKRTDPSHLRAVQKI